MKTSIKNFWILTFLFTLMTSSISFAQSLTDPEIASVAVTANKIDINMADIALKKSTNKDVKDFATMMKKDHKAVIDQAVALVTKLGVTPKDNALSKSLMTSAEKTKKDLNSKSKADFDKAYIDNEVSFHKTVINTVKNTLIPQSQNA